MHLKNLVLRAWWDGESSPSIEVPIGDFFGLGLGEYFVYQSALLAVAPIKALNAYFQMPFAQVRAHYADQRRQSRAPTISTFAVDYVTLPSLPADVGRFHAQYRQAAPCKGWTDDWSAMGIPRSQRPQESERRRTTTSSSKPTGRGHFVGVTQAVEQNQDGWFGEGDDMIFIDGDTAAHHQRHRHRGLLQRRVGLRRPGLRATSTTARRTSSTQSGSAAATASTAGTSRARSRLRSRSA